MTRVGKGLVMCVEAADPFIRSITPAKAGVQIIESVPFQAALRTSKREQLEED